MSVTPRYRTASIFALILATSSGCHTTAGVQRSTSDLVTLSIVGTNDLHGGVLPVDGRGGLALLGGYVDNLRAARARDGGAVLLIDAGDMWQGTLESNLGEGAAVVAAYNTLEYTAAAVGNHEFDFGPVGPASIPTLATDDPRGALKARAAEAAFPMLAANLIDTSTNRPVDWPNVKPSVLVEAAGVKVGIIGVMSAGALDATIAANTGGLRVAPLLETIVSEAGRLRAGGAMVVIVAAHAGGRCARFDDPVDLSSCSPSSEIFTVARGLPPGLVDAIVAGHVHDGMAHVVNGVAIISSFSGGRRFGRIDLSVNRRSGGVATQVFAPRDVCTREVPAAGTCDPIADAGQPRVPSRYEGIAVSSSARVVASLAPAVARVADLKATPLGLILDTPLPRDGVDSAIGNLFTDAMRESVPGADVAILNVAGGLRADFPHGPVTYGRLYEVFPFDNRVVAIPLTGAELRRVLAAQLQPGPPKVGVSSVRVHARCIDGTLVTTMTTESGQAIDDDRRLTIVTTDFLALGGDAVFTAVTPPTGFATADAGSLLRDVVADWMRRRGGRLRAEQLQDPKNPRWVYANGRGGACEG
jgi:2',3'-cyclic-nucleotide 2'-phosphodiesterase (5'-nucleotidase family)